MKSHNIAQITSTLKKIQISKLARQTKFTIRSPRKIDPTSFLVSFFNMLVLGSYSLRIWASQICVLNGTIVSFQSLAKKLDFRHAPFFHALFHRVLTSGIQRGLNFRVGDFFEPFNQVMVEDSTCFKLPKNLFEFFPGARSPRGREAGGRLHLCIYLKSNTYGAIAIRNYSQNDQSHARYILKSMKKGDLLIRDLGYWAIDVFRQIGQLGAYFLSRLHLATHLIDPQSLQIIDLVKLLKKKDQLGINEIDMPILLGKTQQLPLRLVGIKLGDADASKRRKMSRKNRHNNEQISARAWYLMSWNLFVTNVSAELWKTQSVYNVYNLRWHIEMIFKCWKSKFKFQDFFKHCHGRNPVKPEIIILLILTWIILYFVPTFNLYATKVYNNFHRFLSPLKFADFLKIPSNLYHLPHNLDVLKFLSYYCSYDIRKDRKNHYEKIYI